MNYEPNEIDWKVGDIVIHDADSKREDMLMKVIDKCDKCKLITTVYLDFNKGYSKKFGKSDEYSNDKKFLHDPKRFKIKQ